ncbi:MAG TPA: amidohydrolase family protein, partial [Thermoanaerobaculia bacterium]|nr:amidohydrolase family protein [Thermoanaerobaculia bacterium]
ALLEELASWPEPLPVWICSLFRTPSISAACQLADRFPTLQFVFLHGGGPLLLTLADALRPRRNAFVDLSRTLVFYARSSVSLDIRWLLDKFDQRVMFGSDFPEHGIGESLAELRALGEGIADEKLANVLGDNLSRLLRLDHG